MSTARFDELLRSWQDGEASPGDLRELEDLLRNDPLHRRALVGSVLLEVSLYGRYAKSTAQPKAAPRRIRRLEAAAAVLVAAVSLGAVAVLLLRPEEPAHRVLAGEVWTAGTPARSLLEGVTYDVRGEDQASLRLKESSNIFLSAGSAFVIRNGQDPAQRVLELVRGAGSFSVVRGPGSFRLETAAGSVSTRGGAFSAALQKSGTRLAVAVTTGGVEVDYAGARHLVAAGQARTFAPPSGRYQKYLDAAKFTLAEAVVKALEAAPGSAVSVKLDEDDGRIAFTVRIAQDRRVREIDLDAGTGAVFENEQKNSDHSKLVAAFQISLQTAIQSAVKRVPGSAVEAEFELEYGRARAEVEILSDGKLWEVVVDGKTGEIIEVKPTDEEK